MKLIGTITICLFSLILTAQNGYIFEELNDEYIPLTQGDTIVAGRWDDPEVVLNLPFPIKMFGEIQPDGFIFEGGIAMEDTNKNKINVISIFSADLVSSSLDTTTTLSPIILDIQGDEGERMMTLEWRNAHFYILKGRSDFVNIQVKYYEKTGQIQLCYGESSTVLVKDALSRMGEDFVSRIGLGLGDKDTLITGLFLEGRPDKIKLLVDKLGFVSGMPDKNTVYSFTPLSTSIYIPKEDNCFEYIHNRNEGKITILNASNEQIYLIGMNGQIIHSENSKLLNLSNLPEGVYFLKSSSCNQVEKILHR